LLIQKLFNKETVVESATFVLILTIIEKIITLARGVTFARILGPAEYGTYTLAFFLLPLVIPLARLGLPSCYERYVSKYEKRGELGDFLKRNYKLTIGSGIAFTLLIYLFSSQISILLFSSIEYKNIVVLCAISVVPLVFYENILGSFNGLRIFKMSSLLKFCQISIFTLIGIVLVIFHPFAISVVGANLLTSILIAAIFGYLVWKNILSSVPQSSKIQEDDFYKKMFRYSVWFIITPLFSTLFSYTDRLVLNHFLGLHEVGVYSVAMNISQLVFMFGMITGNVLMPNLSKIWEDGDKARVIFILNLAIKFTSVMILCYSFVFVLFRAEILSFLYGNKYEDAISLIPILLLFWLNSSLVWLIGVYPNLIEKPYMPLLAIVPGFILNVFLNYMFIPIFGIKGAAIATLSSQVFILITLLILYRREGLSVNMKTIFICLVPFILLLNTAIMTSVFIFALAVMILSNLIVIKEEKVMVAQQINKLFSKFNKQIK
jgi:O-antigen/teichoic acid export membrane protein